MPIDQLPGEIVVPDRNALRDQYLRDYRFRGPAGVNTAEGSQPYIDASVWADQALPVWAAVSVAGSNLVLSDAQGAAVDTWAQISGTSRNPPTSATGFVVMQTSNGGTTLGQGDQLVDQNANLYTALTAGAYLNGTLCPVQAVTTGTSGNLPAGTVLTWVAPRPGCGPQATVYLNSNGEGLSGGLAQETDAELVQRIINAKANPPASGNDAALQAAAIGVSGLAVQQAFTYPAIKGPGTCGLVFTVPADPTTGSRVPSSASQAIFEGALVNAFPADDGLLFALLVPQLVDVSFTVTWQSGAATWADATPWPPYLSRTGTPSAIVVTAASSPLVFSLGTQTGVYPIGLLPPQIGDQIAFYSYATTTFYQKTILTVTGSGPWAITCDGTNNASDTTFTPLPARAGGAADRAMPWSTSLQSLVPAIQAYFAGLGPGEMTTVFPDPGRRMKRSPAPGLAYPNAIGNRLPASLEAVSGVGDIALVEPVTPYPTTAGAAGISAYLLTLNRIAVFPT